MIRNLIDAVEAMEKSALNGDSNNSKYLDLHQPK